MHGRRDIQKPSELAQLAKRFAAWRKTRAVGSRIPEPLWRAAVVLAGHFGPSRTAMALKLGYYALKERFDEATLTREDARKPAPRPTFVELPAASLAGPPECVIEFENAAGSRMRIHLKGSQHPDLVALGRSFWDSP